MVNETLFTHLHYGWRKHDLPNSHHDHLISALLETHGFLANYGGKYRVEIERTPACSFDGVVNVYWDSDDPKSLAFGRTLRRGEFWFRAFDFNVANIDACRFCGGTGVDHYVGPFFHCWACDGTAKQVRASTFHGFRHRPTLHASQKVRDEYASYVPTEDGRAALSDEVTR